MYYIQIILNSYLCDWTKIGGQPILKKYNMLNDK